MRNKVGSIVKSTIAKESMIFTSPALPHLLMSCLEQINGLDDPLLQISPKFEPEITETLVGDVIG